MERLLVLLPNGDTLETHIPLDATVATILRQILQRFEALLLAKSGLSYLRFPEWRLALTPLLPANGYWNRGQLSHLYAPLPETVAYSSLPGSRTLVPFLTLVHALSTRRVTLANLPHAPAATITMPIFHTMTIEKLKQRIAATLFLPAVAAAQPVRYTWQVMPETNKIEQVEQMALSADCRVRPDALQAEEVDRQFHTLQVRNTSRPSSAMSAARSSRPPTATASIPIIRSRAQSVSAGTATLHLATSIRSEHPSIGDAEDLQPPLIQAGPILLPNLPSSRPSSPLRPRSSRPGSAISVPTRPPSSLGITPALEPLHVVKPVAMPTHRRGRSLGFVPPLLPGSSRPPSQAGPDRPSTASLRQKSRSRSPVRINMSQCPPTLEWDRPKSPLKQQTTGGSWLSNWWTRDQAPKNSPRFHLNRLEAKHQSLKGTHRELLELRMQLDTALTTWIVSFIAEGGLTCFATVLERALGRARQVESEAAGPVCLEVVKCLRVLLNTAPGYEAITNCRELVTALCRTAREGVGRVQTMSNDVLSGLCVSDPVLGATVIERELGDLGPRSFRFDWLTQADNVPPQAVELLRSRLQLINALTSVWETAEERLAFRRELGKDKILTYDEAAKYNEEVRTQLDFWHEFADDDAAELRRSLVDEALQQMEKPLDARSPSLRGTHESAPQNLPVEQQPALIDEIDPAEDDESAVKSDAELLLLKGQVSDMRGLVQSLRQELAVQKETNLQRLDSSPSAPPSPSSKTMTNTEVRSILRPLSRHQRPKSMGSLDGASQTVSPLRAALGMTPSPQRTAMLPPRGRKENDAPASVRVSPVRPLSVRPALRILSNVSERSQEGDQPAVVPSKKDQVEVATANQEQKAKSPEPVIAETVSIDKVDAEPVWAQDQKREDTGSGALADRSNNSPSAVLTVPPPPPPSPGMLLLSRNTPPATGRRRAASKPLKPLFWDKLPPAQVGTGTIWSELATSKTLEDVQDGMTADIQRFFAKDTAPGQRLGPSRFAKKQEPKRNVSLIELTRAKNMEIVLARIRLQPEELRQAILQMDKQKLCNSDFLRMLMDVAPTKEEVAAVKAYTGDTALLGTAEKHTLAFGSIAHLKERLSAMAYRQRFDMDVAELLPDLDTIRLACRDVRDSQVLKDILTLALSAGNTLNASTFRGGAQGFKLDSLLKLADIKSASATKDGATLLHYLVGVHERKIRGRVDFQAALPHCAAASRVSSKTLHDSVSQLQHGLQHVKDQVALVPSDVADSEDVFARKMTSFLERASMIVERLANDASAVYDQQLALLDYLGEEKTTSVEQVFATLAQVLRLLQRASDENVKQGVQVEAPTSKTFVNDNFDNTLRAMRLGHHTRPGAPVRIFSFQ